MLLLSSETMLSLGQLHYSFLPGLFPVLPVSLAQTATAIALLMQPAPPQPPSRGRDRTQPSLSTFAEVREPCCQVRRCRSSTSTLPVHAVTKRPNQFRAQRKGLSGLQFQKRKHSLLCCGGQETVRRAWAGITFQSMFSVTCFLCPAS